MKTLILSCATGQGHNSCAAAIKEYFQLQGVHCDIVDGLGLISRAASAFISWGHSFIYRKMPGFFRWGYSYAEKHPEMLGDSSLACRFLSSAGDKLMRLIEAGGYDCVICTHVFAALMLKNAVKPGERSFASAFVATDYTCSPGAAFCGADLIFIPAAELSGEFTERGADAWRIAVSGIPVRHEFYTSQARDAAKLRFGISPGHRHLLVMGGSMGCGPIEEFLAKLSRQLPEGWEVSVVCAGNHRLEKKLRRLYRTGQGIHILSYVEDMSALMDSAELCVTKPGGISVTEAAVKRLPMLLIDAVSGCEGYNRKRLVESGGAVTAEGVEGLYKKCLGLMADDRALEEMQLRLGRFVSDTAAEIIYTRMREMTHGRKNQS